MTAKTTGTPEDVKAALEAQGLEALKGKGGFWIRNEGWISLAQARKRTGLAAVPRQIRPRQTAYGEWAIVAALSGRLNG